MFENFEFHNRMTWSGDGSLVWGVQVDEEQASKKALEAQGVAVRPLSTHPFPCARNSPQSSVVGGKERYGSEMKRAGATCLGTSSKCTAG